MSCVESGGQKAAPKIFAGAEQIPPPTAVSQQSRDSDEGRCERAAPAPVQLLLCLRNLIYRLVQTRGLSGAARGATRLSGQIQEDLKITQVQQHLLGPTSGPHGPRPSPLMHSLLRGLRWGQS